MQDTDTLSPSRRSFLEKIFTATVFTLAAPTLVLGRLVPSIRESNGAIAGRFVIDITDPKYSALSDVGASLLIKYRSSPTRYIIVTHTALNTYVAVDPRCTHLGCLVEPADDNGTLHCLCHGSAFQADGTLMNGPAEVDLPSFETFYDGSGVVGVEIPTLVSVDDEALHTAFAAAAELDADGHVVSVDLVLEHGADVVASIVSASGSTVASIHDGPLAAGSHVLRGSVSGLASGIYFVRIETGRRSVIARKFVVSR
ncbi:MAG: Rieske 2Fe-2S domain-containing protein [bacterium]|nr:Rieske 2Fe-2S domain-containing protein [Candidatus Kapabacteria bacterium]